MQFSALSPESVTGIPWFETIDEMQAVLDAYLVVYNTKRPHQGRGMNGRTPIVAFIAGIRKGEKPQLKSTKKTA